jgi:ATP-dependent DNA helicase RecG
LTEITPAAQSNDAPLTALRGVGVKLAGQLNKIGIYSCQDLIFHLPFRYEDRTQVTPVAYLYHGQQALILAAIEGAQVQFGRRRSLLVQLNDGGARLTMRLFYFNAQQHKALEQGQWIQCYGEARSGPRGLEMIHPEYKVYELEPDSITTDELTPVYPTTEGVGQTRMRKLVGQAFAQCGNAAVDYLPQNIREELNLLGLSQALQLVHSPNAEDDVNSLLKGTHPAQNRLAIEELLAHHLALKATRDERQLKPAPVINAEGDLWPKLKSALGFTLTSAQARVITELEQDLNQKIPSLRLVQGDVGSGKTIVAAAAALHTVDSGYQAAIMAPTELLAEQHRRNFEAWCEPLGLKVAWLAGRLTAAQRRLVLAEIESGEAQIIVGTHALFQEAVTYNKLGLIVVDEQHRFGVDQRLALKKKGEDQGLVPHQIIMSATPIPRSLSMVYYADMDVSNIDELPPGRLPVQTVVLPNTRREEVQQRVKLGCEQGRQAYWVCPLIEESDALQAQAAEIAAEQLSAALPNLNVALVHGRMKSKEKDGLMEAFRLGETDLLVATTVIEVGVDVANASLMIIENAERLGLAQLHQLRGRVGRGADQAVCVMMYQSPLGKNGKTRLDILRQTSDGFEIARHDLEQRGPGELMGTRQTGDQSLKVANIVRDQGLLPTVEKTTKILSDQNPEIRSNIIRRWVKEKDQYAQV